MTRPSTTSSLSCPPRYATRRRPERESFGPELAAVAVKLGQPFMPWQRLVADVGGEINPLTGLPAYREVRVTVPRQSGKTTLFLSWQINRCVSRRWAHPQRSVFTAQTGKDARDKWIDELFPLIRNSAIKQLVNVKGSRIEINEGMGNESIRFKTGSLIRLLSTATTSGHSKTLHQAVMDEVWHDTDDRREQGLRPAMITVADAQLLVCSTAGTDASVILNRKVETGRAAVVADRGTGVAYFEWSAPDWWDPFDEDSYYGFMPALCPNPPCRCAGDGSWHHTITSIEVIRGEREDMELAEFKRAYGNVKASSKDGDWQHISEAQWGDASDPVSTALDPVAFSVDVTPERHRASIAAVGARADGHLHGVVVDHRDGTDWVVGRLVELVLKWRPCAVSLVGTSAAFTLHADLVAKLSEAGSRLEVKVMTNRELAAGFGMTVDAICARVDQSGRRLRWRTDLFGAELTAAVKGAVKREIGEGSAWDRSSSSVDISPLVALTNAVYTFVSTAVPPPVAVANPKALAQSSNVFRPSGRLKI